MYLTNVNSLKTACLTAVNSALLSCENHSRDNSFISPEPREVCEGLSLSGVFPLGFCSHVPYSHYETKQIAMVIDDQGTIKWCHFPEIAYERLLYRLFGNENVAKIRDRVLAGESLTEEDIQTA